jgi:nucleoside-diphosphate-sugar epimerase
VVFAYGFSDFGPRLLDETSPPATESPSNGMRRAHEGVLALEQQTIEASSRGDVEGVVLRFGTLYGPDVPSSEFMLTMLKLRLMALPGGGHSVLPWITLSDAVRAIVLALHSARAGEIYNIVDGEPVTVHAFVTELARACGTPMPYSIPYRLGRLLMPFGAPFLDRTVLRPTNEKATRDLGWVPDHQTYRDGIRGWVRMATGPAATHGPATNA